MITHDFMYFPSIFDFNIKIDKHNKHYIHSQYNQNQATKHPCASLRIRHNFVLICEIK